MRARRGIALGWLVVGLYGAALVGVAATARDGVLRPGDRPDGGRAAQEFTAAWERSRTATFVRSGTFERRSEVTGAVITSEDVVAQRPPRRIHRQLGGVLGRDDDRVVTCPAGPVSSRCYLGEPAGPSYDEWVAAELVGLRSILGGSSPLYAVARAGEGGCFDLAQQRVDPRAPFGVEARFCFDRATGAPTDSRVRYEGGIVEVVAVTEVRAVVTDADLEP